MLSEIEYISLIADTALRISYSASNVARLNIMDLDTLVDEQCAAAGQAVNENNRNGSHDTNATNISGDAAGAALEQPGPVGPPGQRLQLAWDQNGIHPVDVQAKAQDLLPYQAFLLQYADEATLQRYRDKILLAYCKSLEYVGRAEEGEDIVKEKLTRGQEIALREMAVEVNGLFRMIDGPMYDVEVVRNAIYMGGCL